MNVLCLTAMLTSLAALPSAGADVTLVRDGRPAATLVVARDAPPPEAFAAEEIGRYVAEMSGARLPLAHAVPRSGLAVCVGRGPWAPADPAGDHWADGYTIRVTPGRVVVAGETPRGTLYAAYALLERLGCRWFAPNFAFYSGGKGEWVPRVQTLALPDGETRERPAWRYRAKYVEEGHSHNAGNLPALVDWMAKARLNVFCCPADYGGTGRVRWDAFREALAPELRKRGLLVEVGGHGYQNYLPADRHFAEHPEWFGVAGGKRVRAKNRVFCTSNAAALDEVTRSVLAYLRARPEIDIFDLWPPDGARWCECAACQALGEPTVRHARVVNHVAAAVARELPRVTLEFIAYSSYLDPPEGIAFAPNTLVGLCPIARSFATPITDPEHQTNRRYWDALSAWLKRPDARGRLYIYSYFRKYAWRSLPVLVPRLIAHDVARYREAGAIGMSSYSEPDDWLTYEIQHLALARAAWESHFEAETFVEAYCRDRFGPAAAPMRRFFAQVEAAVPQACAIPGTPDPGPEALARHVETLADAQHALDESRRLLAGEPARHILVERLGVALEYARLDVRRRADPGQAEALTAQIEALLAAHRGEGVYLKRR